MVDEGDGNGSERPAANRPYKPVQLKVKPLKKQVFELQSRVALLELQMKQMLDAMEKETAMIESWLKTADERVEHRAKHGKEDRNGG